MLELELASGLPDLLLRLMQRLDAGDLQAELIVSSLRPKTPGLHAECFAALPAHLLDREAISHLFPVHFCEV